MIGKKTPYIIFSGKMEIFVELPNILSSVCFAYFLLTWVKAFKTFVTPFVCVSCTEYIETSKLC